jgi:hypothetical protein
MDEDIPIESSEPSTPLRPILFNILALFFLVLSCLCPGFSVLVFASPNSPLNPLPPGGFGRWSPIPTSTQTPLIYYPPTWTPTPSVERTVPPTRTPAPVTPTYTLYYDPDNPNPQPTQGPFYLFVPQTGHPEYSPSPMGCAWTGITGTVFNAAELPVNNLLVLVQGTFAGLDVEVEQVTGSLGEDRRGEYEIVLGDEPAESINDLSIVLLDGNRTQLSKKILFNTYVGCDKNLVTLNFVQANQ